MTKGTILSAIFAGIGMTVAAILAAVFGGIAMTPAAILGAIFGVVVMTAGLILDEIFGDVEITAQDIVDEVTPDTPSSPGGGNVPIPIPTLPPSAMPFSGGGNLDVNAGGGFRANRNQEVNVYIDGREVTDETARFRYDRTGRRDTF
jgi:hypothetical protein